MLIKVHLSGVAIAYEPHGKPFDGETKFPSAGRVQGSRYNQQKRKIADAVEYMRRCGKYKPVIFVATSPGFIPDDRQKGYIKALTHYLRRSCDAQDYVWVRENTKKGFPHYHFIADMPFPTSRNDFRTFALEISRYWSSLFGVYAENSIRFGTKPPRRKFFIDGPEMAWYMSKYIGKALQEKNRVRRYDISRNARQCSEPVTYAPQMQIFYPGTWKHKQVWTADVEDPDGIPHYQMFDPHKYLWRRCGDHSVFIGVPKRDKRKNLKSTVVSQ